MAPPGFDNDIAIGHIVIKLMLFAPKPLLILQASHTHDSDPSAALKPQLPCDHKAFRQLSFTCPGLPRFEDKDSAACILYNRFHQCEEIMRCAGGRKQSARANKQGNTKKLKGPLTGVSGKLYLAVFTLRMNCSSVIEY